MLYGLMFDYSGDARRLHAVMVQLPGSLDLMLRGRTIASHDAVLLGVIEDIARERGMPYCITNKDLNERLRMPIRAEL